MVERKLEHLLYSVTDTLVQIQFPYVAYDSNEHDIYVNLEPAHVYYFFLGNNGIRRALRYLDNARYEQNLFHLQTLPLESDLYKSVQKDFIKDKPIRIIRFRVQSNHHQSAFNQGGYRCYIIYIPVVRYDKTRNDRFRLVNDASVSNITDTDFYFKNVIKAWFCTCKTGARNVGACSHIIAGIISFGHPSDFSKARYLPVDPTSFAFPQY